jgi:hypothetical protein
LVKVIIKATWMWCQQDQCGLVVSCVDFPNNS